MPVVNVIPNSVTSLAFDEWSLTGANKAVAVAPGDAFPVTHDDMTTRIQGAGNSTLRTQDVKCNSTKWPSSIGSISYLKVGTRITVDGAPSTCVIKWGPANASGWLYTETVPTGGTVWQTLGPTAHGKPGGGQWVAADCSEHVTWLRINGYSNDAQTHYCTSLWFEMDYSVGHGFVLGLIFSIGGVSALPLAGAIADFGQFRTWLDWAERRKQAWLKPHEVIRAWDELKAYPFPHHFVLGC